MVTESRRRTSRLLVSQVTEADAGNYTCAPAESKTDSVTVHVIKGEFVAVAEKRCVKIWLKGKYKYHTEAFPLLTSCYTLFYAEANLAAVLLMRALAQSSTASLNERYGCQAFRNPGGPSKLGRKR